MKKYFINIIRGSLRNKASYIGATMVIAIGLLIFVSMSDVFLNLKVTLDQYYAECKFADVFARVYSFPVDKLKNLGKIPGITAVSGRLTGDIRLQMENNTNLVTVHILAVDPEQTLNLVQMSKPDMTDNEIALGQKMYDFYNFQPGDEIKLVSGDSIYTMKIAGTVQEPEYIYAIPPSGSQISDNEIYDIACVNRSKAEKLLGQEQMITELGFSLAPGVYFHDVKQQLQEELAPYGIRYLEERANQTSNYMFEVEFDQLLVTGTALPAVFLAVSAFMLYVVMRKILDQDRSLIGTMKAFGLTNKELITGYFKQSALVALVGASLGSLLAIPFEEFMYGMYLDFFNLPYSKFQHYASTRLTGAVVALLICWFSIYSNMREVINIQPAEAMRAKSPVIKKQVLLPPFIKKYLNSAQKMSLRFVIRNHLRTLMMAFSVAFPFALTAVMFSYDAVVDQMLYSQFTKIETYDMKVDLSSYEDRHKLLNEISQLEGVYDVEALARYDVVLQHENLQKISRIMGLNKNSENYRIMSLQGDFLAPPEKGLTMNTMIARKLQVKEGDMVEIQSPFLSVTPVQLPVVKVFEESFGQTCYIDLETMSSCFNVGATANMAVFKIMPGYSDSVKKKLREAGKVTAVSESERVLKIYHTIMESMATMMNMFSLFALLLGAVLIYNLMNISLRERQHEFGTMLIMGTNYQELENIITFEQKVVFTLGILFGYPLTSLLNRIMTSILASEVYTVKFSVPGLSYMKALIICGFIAFVSLKIISRNIRQFEPADILKERE